MSTHQHAPSVGLPRTAEEAYALLAAAIAHVTEEAVRSARALADHVADLQLANPAAFGAAAETILRLVDEYDVSLPNVVLHTSASLVHHGARLHGVKDMFADALDRADWLQDRLDDATHTFRCYRKASANDPATQVAVLLRLHPTGEWLAPSPSISDLVTVRTLAKIDHCALPHIAALAEAPVSLIQHLGHLAIRDAIAAARAASH